MLKSSPNFSRVLPEPLTDLAEQTLKDPYNFDFLTIRKNYDGKEYRLEVGGDEFFTDLLFYHLKLRCYIVIELKTEKFKPEHLGQLGFYVTAVDKDIKSPEDNPTIGLLICKTKNEVVAEYSLGVTSLPIGISQYELNEFLNKEYKNSLPTIDEIENQLKD